MAQGEAAKQETSTADRVAADVGKRIRQVRLERGMTLSGLGGDQLSKSFLSLVERGRTRISLRALSIVADRLDLPVGYFLATPDAATELATIALDRAEAALAQQQPDESIRLLDRASLPLPLRPRALVLRGRALIDLGQAKDAVSVLADALTLADKGDDGYLATLVRYHLGAALYAAGSYPEALVHLQHALARVMAEAQDDILLGKITIYLGHVHYIRGDMDGALQHYARARDLFGSFGDLGTLACIYSGLSLAYERKGDLASAVRYSTLSLGAFEAKQNLRQAARELNNLAVMYEELGDLERADACARDAIVRSQQVDAPELEALAHSTLALVYLHRDQGDQARVEAEHAEALSADDDGVGRIDAWRVLAELAERAGDLERADTFYRRALTALKHAGRDTKYARAALAYSRLLRQRGEMESALDYALEAAHVSALLPTAAARS